MAREETNSMKLLRQASELVDERLTAGNHEQHPVGDMGDSYIKASSFEGVFEGLPIDSAIATSFSESQARTGLQMIEEMTGHTLCEECRRLVAGALAGQMIRGLAIGQMAVSMESLDEVV